MSRVKTIIAVIGVVLLVIFAIQNSAAIVIRFLTFNFSISQALVIVLSAAVGVIIGLLVGLNSSVKASKTAKELNKSQTELQKNIDSVNAENNRLLAQIEAMNVQIGELNQQIAKFSNPTENAPELSGKDFNDGVDALDI